MLIKSANGKNIKIIDRLAPSWNHFGILLEFDGEGTAVDIIYKKHRGDPLDCCHAMFRHWLNGNRRTPLSWRTLIELLQDFNQEVLAGEVRSALIP